MILTSLFVLAAGDEDHSQHDPHRSDQAHHVDRLVVTDHTDPVGHDYADKLERSHCTVVLAQQQGLYYQQLPHRDRHSRDQDSQQKLAQGRPVELLVSKSHRKHDCTRHEQQDAQEIIDLDSIGSFEFFCDDHAPAMQTHHESKDNSSSQHYDGVVCLVVLKF